MLKKTLARHIRTAHSVQPAQKRCEVCHGTFKRKDILERHTQEQHSGQSNIVECALCGSFVSNRALQEHFHSQKCGNAWAKASQPSTKRVDMLDIANINSYLGTASSLDPLVIAASLYWSTLKLFVDSVPSKSLGSKRFVLPPTKHDRDCVDEWAQWSRCIEAASLSRNLFDSIACKTSIASLPILQNLWTLRGLVLSRSRATLEGHSNEI